MQRRRVEKTEPVGSRGGNALFLAVNIGSINRQTIDILRVSAADWRFQDRSDESGTIA
jgi:hypothetical protein